MDNTHQPEHVGSGHSGTPWGWLNRVFVVLIAVFLVGAVFFLFQQPKVLPEAREASAQAEEYEAVKAAATAAIEAFIDIDYLKIDEQMQRVKELSTGVFLDEYTRGEETTKNLIRSQESTGSGEVLQVGVGDLDGSEATVFVAANQDTSNKTLKKEGTGTLPRFYRFQIDMEKDEGTWKMARLSFIKGGE